MAELEEETSFDTASTDCSDSHAADIIEPVPDHYTLHKSTKSTPLHHGQTDIINMQQNLFMNDNLYRLNEKEHQIEQLKHEKLILEEWKTEVGLVAVSNVETLQSQIETQQTTAQQYQLEIEGLQTQNHALTQQISAYQDEVNIIYFCICFLFCSTNTKYINFIFVYCYDL